MAHTQETKSEAIRLYIEEKLPQRSIAARLKMTDSTVRKILDEAGILLTGKQKPQQGRRISADRRRAIVAQYAAGGTAPAVAAEHGVGVAWVYRAARAAGVPGHNRCTHWAAVSEGYGEAVAAVAGELGVDPELLRKLLTANGLSAYEPPGR